MNLTLTSLTVGSTFMFTTVPCLLSAVRSLRSPLSQEQAHFNPAPTTALLGTFRSSCALYQPVSHQRKGQG